jgi:hypothetical protein
MIYVGRLHCCVPIHPTIIMPRGESQIGIDIDPVWIAMALVQDNRIRLVKRTDISTMTAARDTAGREFNIKVAPNYDISPIVKVVFKAMWRGREIELSEGSWGVLEQLNEIQLHFSSPSPTELRLRFFSVSRPLSHSVKTGPDDNVDISELKSVLAIQAACAS